MKIIIALAALILVTISGIRPISAVEMLDTGNFQQLLINDLIQAVGNISLLGGESCSQAPAWE